MPALPLQGRLIVVTRPLAQAGALAAGIRAQGGAACLFPLLEISPWPDDALLRVSAARLADYRFAVFVSPNAVRYALPLLLSAGAWPPATRAVAVGERTAQDLRAAGVRDCLYPHPQTDSEALLALPEFSESAVRGKKAVIFRGGGGRELLAQTLTARGAQVDFVPVYQRSGPDTASATWTEFCARLAAGDFAALTLSSSEALRYLVERCPPAQTTMLRQTPLFASHARIVAAARAAGFLRVIETETGDAGLLAGLNAYNWRQS
ncbi:MAG: uroporphyrinogen-III synthase [Zoogloeaceae bacterium]|jgi:uroporphyrinogen-III synthase|nr:uroporphyrinogen-III synthase [Zoogloeaceae bacterium]